MTPDVVCLTLSPCVLRRALKARVSLKPFEDGPYCIGTHPIIEWIHGKHFWTTTAFMRCYWQQILAIRVSEVLPDSSWIQDESGYTWRWNIDNTLALAQIAGKRIVAFRFVPIYIYINNHCRCRSSLVVRRGAELYTHESHIPKEEDPVTAEVGRSSTKQHLPWL